MIDAVARFADDRSSYGLEVELNLTDESGMPAMLNAAVLERVAEHAHCPAHVRLARSTMGLELIGQAPPGARLAIVHMGEGDNAAESAEMSRRLGISDRIVELRIEPNAASPSEPPSERKNMIVAVTMNIR